MQVFGEKLLNTQCGVGRCVHKLPIMKWANVFSLKKKFTEPNAASHNNTIWYTDTEGFLEQSSRRKDYTTRGLPSRK